MDFWKKFDNILDCVRRNFLILSTEADIREKDSLQSQSFSISRNLSCIVKISPDNIVVHFKINK